MEIPSGRVLQPPSERKTFAVKKSTPSEKNTGFLFKEPPVAKGVKNFFLSEGKWSIFTLQIIQLLQLREYTRSDFSGFVAALSAVFQKDDHGKF